MTSSHFERGGISFNYREEGDPSGLPFVFEHGLGGDVEQPAGVFSPPEGVRLISMDCRGHGETRPLGDPAKLAFSAYADDVVALINHLKLDKAVVGGISMGASVALNLASRHPERVCALILSRTAWLRGAMPKENAYLYFLIARLIREHGPEAGRKKFLLSDAYRRIEDQSASGAASLLGEFDRARVEETVEIYEHLPASAPVQDEFEFASLTIPTLILANRRDPIHPFEYGEELARSIPNAHFEELTPKSLNEEQHLQEVQTYVEEFLWMLL